MQQIEEATMHNKSVDFDAYLTSMDGIIEKYMDAAYQCANSKYPNGMVPQLFRNFTKCKAMEKSIYSALFETDSTIRQ